jgi:RNA polymerase sigma factor (sigma-70 family)
VPGFSSAAARCRDYSPLSIDAALEQGGEHALPGLALARMIPARAAVAELVIEHEAAAELRAAIETLDERRRRVIESRYYADRPLEDVARTLRVSKQRASQLHCTALATLSANLAVA